LHFQQAITVVGVSVALIAAPLTAQASDWFLAASGQSGASKFFLDRDSIVRNGNKAKANTFVVFGTPTEEGTVAYTASSEFSCSDRKQRDTQINYMRNDGSTRRNNIADDWNTVNPGSVMEAVLQQACGY
jgi:hypothetical protein